MGFLESLGVDGDEVGSVLAIDEDGALAVGHGEFRLVVEGNGAYDGAVGGIDGGGVLAASIEGENAFGGRIINNGVGICVGFHGTQRLEGFEIEDYRGVRAAGTDEAAAQVGDDGDAVDTLRVGDIALDGVGVGVHDDDVRAVGDVDAAGVGIDEDVVPAFIAGNRDSLDEVIPGSARGGGDGGHGRGEANKTENG